MAAPPKPLRWILTAVVALWALLSAGLLISMVSPWMPTEVMSLASAVGYALNPALLLLAAFGAVVALVSVRRARRVVSSVVVVLTGLLVAGFVVPTVSLVRAAAQHDVSLSATALVQGPSGGLGEPTGTTTYAEVDGQALKMDVWQAQNRDDAARAAVIYVFGGGFKSGSRSDWAPFFQHLTSQGISVFAMDYRLSSAQNPSWQQAPADVACAVGWVRQHAETYDIDADRLVLSGGSAGANLALLTAYSAGTGAITPSCSVTDTSVRAVVDFYGPADLAETARSTVSPPVTDALEQYLGASADQEPERYARLSPSQYISAGLPPTLILHGKRDSGVPVQQSIDLADALDEAGVPNQLVLLPAAEHGFDSVFGSLANQIAQAELTRFLDEYVIQ